MVNKNRKDKADLKFKSISLLILLGKRLLRHAMVIFGLKPFRPHLKHLYARRKVIYLQYPQKTIYYFLRILGYKPMMPNLSYIALFITNICNLHCKMCDVGMQNKRGFDRLRQNGPIFMSLELLDKILNDHYLKKNKMIFSLMMTEPLLHPQIETIVDMIKKKDHHVRLTTNGYLLPDKAEMIAPNLDNLQVSIDGPPEIHDSIRGVQGAYNNAIRGIEIANKINPSLSISVNCVVSNLNYNSISDLINRLERENVKISILGFNLLEFVSKEMALLHNQVVDGVEAEVSSLSYLVNPRLIDNKILSQQIAQIKDYKPRNIDRVVFIPNIDSQIDIDRYFDLNGAKLNSYNKCSKPFETCSIKTDGQVIFHVRCFDYLIGSVKRSGLKNIFFSREARLFRKEFVKHDYCFPACTRCCGTKY